jgi:hypothetical protein
MVRVRGFRGLVNLACLAALATTAGCSDCSLSITTKSLPDGVVGTNYFSPLNSDCGGDVWFIQTGSLPPGIELQSNGDVQGIPTLEGDYLFTVGVFDFGSGETAYKGLSIRVQRE